MTLDLLLQAQQRRAEAESAYYRSLVDYNRAIMRVHCRKGSLLEYNGIFLQEGPWPGKAYFDATRRARQSRRGDQHGLRIYASERHEPRGRTTRPPERRRAPRTKGRSRRSVPEPIAPPAAVAAGFGN